MEDQKISELTLGTPLATDVIPYVDGATGTTKKAVKSDLQGAQGATGAQGAAGAQGSQGAAGAQGAQGSAGAQGSQGAAGAQGATGSQGAAGAQGAQGSQGAQGTQGVAGGAMAWKGAWSSGTAYVVNDAVEYNGSSYISIQNGTNQNPATQTAYWTLFAQKGAQGDQGAQGAAGAQGNQGTQGAQGAQGAQGSQGASGLAGGTLTGDTTFGENVMLIMDAALSADGKFCGPYGETGTAGETLAFGTLVYFKAADSRWWKTDADAEATAGPVKIGIVTVAAANAGDAVTIMRRGKIRADSLFPALTVGAPVYVSTTAGEIQTAQPSGTDDVIRIIGYGNTADELDFFPDNTYTTHT